MHEKLQELIQILLRVIRLEQVHIRIKLMMKIQKQAKDRILRQVNEKNLLQEVIIEELLLLQQVKRITQKIMLCTFSVKPQA